MTTPDIVEAAVTASPSSVRASHWTAAAAALTALLLVAFMIASVTGAAWIDTTENEDNSWATGQVVLADDDPGVAMFDAEGLMPGDTVTNDITVSNQSSVPLDVRLYTAGFAETNDLGDHLLVTIRQDDASGSVLLSESLADLAADHTSFATGVAPVTLAVPGAGDSATYHFTVTLSASAPDSVQNSAASIDFVWEGQTAS